MQNSHLLLVSLQEVYGKLEEPDGLAGLLRLRQGPPRLQDQLLAAEKAGSWSEALALHEQALQHDTPQLAREQGSSTDPMRGKGGLTGGQRGYLRCLLHMGHLQGMMTQVDGWASRSSGTCACRVCSVQSPATAILPVVSRCSHAGGFVWQHGSHIGWKLVAVSCVTSVLNTACCRLSSHNVGILEAWLCLFCVMMWVVLRHRWHKTICLC